MLKTWRDGEKGEVVQAIIEANFKILGKYLSKIVLVLSTLERESLSGDYLSDKLIVFDTDLESWFQYKSGNWSPFEVESSGSNGGYTFEFLENDWTGGIITIPYSNHLILNPCVQLYILDDNGYNTVLGGVAVDEDNNIMLSTDLPFAGKVVIK